MWGSWLFQGIPEDRLGTLLLAKKTPVLQFHGGARPVGLPRTVPLKWGLPSGSQCLEDHLSGQGGSGLLGRGGGIQDRRATWDLESPAGGWEDGWLGGGGESPPSPLELQLGVPQKNRGLATCMPNIPPL